jgi:dTDP-4-amino-4,6-dideoxygalactose transaminase
MSGHAKTTASDLALLGGTAAFREPLCVGRPNVGDVDAVLARIRGALERGQLTNRGPLVCELERRIAALIGVRHCIAMCNATVALEIAARALGMRGEVIVPSMSFVATAHALQWQEITPVFGDVDERTHTLDPACLDALVTPRTTGIVAVHLWGRPCDVAGITAVARRHGLKLLFDAAHAFGSTYRGAMIGGFGDAEVLSFHATKVLNTFEGGAVVTNDDALAQKVRLMQNFGFSGYDRVVHLGTNGKMSEISAAMGLASLEQFDGFVAHNRDNARHYERALAGISGLSLLEWDESERSNFHYVVAEVEPRQSGIARDELIEVLHAENVVARRYFYPGIHRMEPYRSYFPNARLLLRRTERIVERVLVLPTGAAVGAPEIDAIAGILRCAVAHAAEVKARLRAPALGRGARMERAAAHA